MGARKLKWKDEEENALKAGVEKYGTGKWRTILQDPVFGAILSARSNVDLKDKWRNMTAMNSSVAPPKEGKKLKKRKSDTQVRSPATPNADSDLLVCDDMIIDAIRFLQGSHGGPNINTIYDYLKSQYQLPPGFKKILVSKLKDLVSQGLVEKNNNRYRTKSDEIVLDDAFFLDWDLEKIEELVTPEPLQIDFDNQVQIDFDNKSLLQSGDLEEDCFYSSLFDRYLAEGIVTIS